MFSRRVVAVIVALLLCAAGRSSSQTEADWDWVNQHFSQALNELFPVEVGGFGVSYRSHRDLYTDVLEYSFVIEVAPPDTPEILQTLQFAAHVRLADSVSIYNQMMALHRQNPNQSFADIRSKLKVKQWRLSESACPAVKSRIAQLQRVRIAPGILDEVVLHPLLHEFNVQGGGIGEMKIVVASDNSALVKWALDTRRSFESCSRAAD